MPPVKSLICYLFIVWLTLLSGGSQAYALVDSVHELKHLNSFATDAAGDTGTRSDGNAVAIPAHDHDHVDTCGPSQCGHGHNVGLPASSPTHSGDEGGSNPFAALQAWVHRYHPDSIERPKWFLTTLAVVNLQS